VLKPAPTTQVAPRTDAGAANNTLLGGEIEGSNLDMTAIARLVETRGSGRIWISIASALGGFLLWEILVRASGVSALIIVPPSDVAKAFVEMLGSGTLWRHAWVSAEKFGFGYGIAVVIGIPLGLAMGQIRLVRDIFYPWVIALYATPSISLAPLILVWLGFGLISKAFVVALLCFFPVVLNAMAGAENLQQEWKDVAKAYSANRWEYFFKVVAPGSTPYVFAGLRLAIGRGLVGIVAADLFGSDEGLGYLLLRSARNFRTADIFVIAIIFALFGVLLTMLFSAQEKAISPWKK
jgi:ABC-type nitrate/sulfonate/bicarbonate transport system permease component